MSQTPEEIRADIERTRTELGLDIDATANKVSPSAAAHRQADKAKEALGNVTTGVMGAAEGAKNSAGSAAHRAGNAIQDAPHTLKTKAQGNPLAAGLIAFGAGLLAASLIPASEKEKEAASALKEKAEPLVSEATDAAKQVASGLKEPATEALDSVKQSATDSAQNVAEEGKHAASDLQDRAGDAKQNVQDSRS